MGCNIINVIRRFIYSIKKFIFQKLIILFRGDIMGRKKQEGVTTRARYLAKMYRIGLAIAGGNEEYAKLYAESLLQSRTAGYSPFKDAWNIAKAVLTAEKIPSMRWGIYRSFVFQLVNRVIRQGKEDLEKVIERYVEEGDADENVLRAIAERIMPQFKPEVTAPAQKVA